MRTVEAEGNSLDELAHALQSVDPRVRLLAPRILRRVIRGVFGVSGFGRQLPHRGGFSTSSESALRFASRDELGLPNDATMPDHLILLAEPDLDELSSTREQVLTRLWRELFHARIHVAFEERADLHSSEEHWLTSRIEQIGRLQFAEARAMLYEDQYLVLPADDRTTFVEFAAAYLELQSFHPDLISHTFPAIKNHETIRKMLAADIDTASLFEATRLPGALDHPSLSVNGAFENDIEAEDKDEVGGPSPGSSPFNARRWARYKAQADNASKRGNNVRAAILRTRSVRLSPALEGPRTKSAARSELDKLARRLRAAIGFDAKKAGLWRRTLPVFLDRAAKGVWPREARLLYDLQKVCSDQERAIYAVDLAGWIVSLGKRPIRRLLPDHREILVLSHLRSAAGQLRRIRGPEPARGQLELLIEHAIHLKEAQIRERFRDRIRDAFDRVSLCPSNLPERAARRKLVEELLDLIVERGYLRIGDLRDSISRSQLKLPDLSGVGEFINGDPLLRADTELARSLDGVYHRGELYLRALQRGSSLAFGTKIGRFLTRVVALPFGGAFVTLEGIQHMVEPIIHLFGGVAPELFNTVSFISLSLLLLGLINVPAFWQKFLGICSQIAWIFKAIFYSAPKWLFARRIVQEIVRSRVMRLVCDWLVKPVAIVAVFSLVFPLDIFSEQRALFLRAVAVAAVSLFINSRQGRVIEEIAADGASRVGQRIWRDLLPNFFRGIMDFFRAALETFERLLYTVDEWLRFRGGENRLMLVGKAVTGLVWFAIAYVIRIYVTILIEPQFNPIKHFPVVTVAAKIMIPMTQTLFSLLRVPFLPLGVGIANTLAAGTLFFLPGLFGFLVWELKENWRLYAANRSRFLRPVVIGHHGESMSRLLRRGFHSGTLPKLFAKLRKKDRDAEGGEGLGASHKLAKSIHEVEVAIRHFVDRGIVYLLEESRAIGQLHPTTGKIECSTSRIIVELCHQNDAGSAAKIAFEESERRLHTRLLQPGWLVQLDVEARRVLLTALAGLYAMSDVEVVDHPTDFDQPGIPAPRVEWSSWVQAWESDLAGIGHVSVVSEEIPLLPASNASAEFESESTLR